MPKLCSICNRPHTRSESICVNCRNRINRQRDREREAEIMRWEAEQEAERRQMIGVAIEWDTLCKQVTMAREVELRTDGIRVFEQDQRGRYVQLRWMDDGGSLGRRRG